MDDVILEQLPEAIILTDTEGIILGWMGSSQQFFGYSSDEMVGQNLEVLFSEEQTVREIVKIVAKKGQFLREIQCVRRNRSHFFSEICAKTIYDNSKTPVGILLSIRDISERTGPIRSQSNTETRRLLADFAGGVAHDFNNILTAIIGSLSLSKLYLESNDNLNSAIDDIEEASREAAKITKKLLAFSKGGIRSGNDASIDKIIRETTQKYIQGSRVQYNFSIPAEIGYFRANEGLLSQLVKELVKNAQDAMPNGGQLLISIEKCTIQNSSEIPLKPGQYVQISFKDNGVGISDEFIPYLFNPFHVSNDKCSGLSLATTYSIAENLGGHIAVKSKLSKGTTFFLYLPAISSTAE